jgi:carbon starvation protein
VLTWLVLAAFASIIGTLFDTFPASVFPVNLEIPIAVAIGFWVHRKGGGILLPSIVAVLVMWGAVWVSTNYEPLQWKFPDDAALKPGQIWVGLLLGYSFITCILPVWVLLQPRDFINSHQLFVGLGVIYLALFIVNPEITAPTINDQVPAGVGDLFPFLFVTIACGAISGFHSLVSSGTTSKQLKSVKDAKAVGYGSMLGEGALALAATMAVAAGFSAAEWHAHYGDAANVKGKGLIAFVQGTSNLLTQGFPFIDGKMAAAIVAVIVISFAATTLDTACRIQRFCLAELGRAWKVAPLRNIYVGAAIAAFTPLALVIEPAEGPPLWRQVWPVFGSANQVLGALALLVITLWLKKKGKPLWFTGIPALFLTVITMTGLSRMVTAQLERDTPVWAVLAPASVLLVLAAAILVEGGIALLRPARASSRP